MDVEKGEKPSFLVEESIDVDDPEDLADGGLTLEMVSPRYSTSSAETPSRKGSVPTSPVFALESFVCLPNSAKKGIPAKVIFVSLRKMKNDRKCIELLKQLVFIGLYWFLLSYIVPATNFYETTMLIDDALFDEEFVNVSFKKNYYDIFSFEEYWQWVQGPLVNAVYFDTVFNGDPVTDYNRLNLGGYSGLRVSGPIRFSTVRVQNGTCLEFGINEVLSFWYNQSINRCYPDYSSGNRDLGPWGTFQTSGISKIRGIPGFGGRPFEGYGDEAYVYFLPTVNMTNGVFHNYYSPAYISNIVKTDLIDKFWTDQATRALAVDFNVVSLNTGVIVAVRSVVEMLQGGGFVPYTRSYPVQPGSLSTTTDILVFCVCVIFAAWNAQRFISRIYFLCKMKFALAYMFSSPWKFIKILSDILTFFVILLLMIGRYGIYDDSFVKSATLESAESNTEFYDMFDRARYMAYITYLGLISLGFAFLEIFAHLPFERINVLWVALGTALPDILALTVVFLILNTCFSIWGYLLFGTWVRDFHTFSAAFSTLLRSVFSGLDYDNLYRVEPNSAILFYVVYIFFEFLVLLNMFIAVVTETYSQVKEHQLLERRLDGCDVIVVSSIGSWWQRLKYHYMSGYYSTSRCFCCFKSKKSPTRRGTAMSSYTVSYSTDVFRASTRVILNGLPAGSAIRMIFAKYPSFWDVSAFSPAVLRNEMGRWDRKYGIKKDTKEKYSGFSPLPVPGTENSPYRKLWWYFTNKVVCDSQREGFRRSVGASSQEFAEEVQKYRTRLEQIYGYESPFLRTWRGIKEREAMELQLREAKIEIRSNKIRKQITKILSRAYDNLDRENGMDLFDVFSCTYKAMGEKCQTGNLLYPDILKLLAMTQESANVDDAISLINLSLDIISPNMESSARSQPSNEPNHHLETMLIAQKVKSDRMSKDMQNISSTLRDISQKLESKPQISHEDTISKKC